MFQLQVWYSLVQLFSVFGNGNGFLKRLRLSKNKMKIRRSAKK